MVYGMAFGNVSLKLNGLRKSQLSKGLCRAHHRSKCQNNCKIEQASLHLGFIQLSIFVSKTKYMLWLKCYWSQFINLSIHIGQDLEYIQCIMHKLLND